MMPHVISEMSPARQVACCRCMIGNTENDMPGCRAIATALNFTLACNLWLREPSAAQNVTVNHFCTHCGAVIGAKANTCRVCDTPLPRGQRNRPAVALKSATTAGNLAIAHNWRDEVSHRLEAYRTRHQQGPADPSQPAFSFDVGPGESRGTPALETPAPSKASIQSWHYRPRRLERVEIDVAQPAFDFPGAQLHPAGALAAPQTLHPVASLAERCRAGLRDAALLLIAYGGFLTLFAALGGHFSLSKLDFVVTVATFALFYAQYFTLFTFFGGATPGMMLTGMRVVTFDGAVPKPRQMLWRSFGYVVSAGTVMLGFLWALWDEDHLCWHDRISQTYVTLAINGASPAPPTGAMAGSWQDTGVQRSAKTGQEQT